MEPMKHVTWAAANEHINVYVRVIFSRHMRITYKRNDWTLKLLCTRSHQSATSLLRYFKFFFSHPSLPQNFKWYTVLLRRLVSSLDIFSELHEINLNLEMIVYPGLTQGGSPEKFCTLGWKNEIRWAGDPNKQLYYIIGINSGGNPTTLEVAVLNVAETVTHPVWALLATIPQFFLWPWKYISKL